MCCASPASMSRILLDQNVPVGIRQLLRQHEVRTAYQMGWADLSNGELLAAMDASGFELLISSDQNLVHQQSLVNRRIAVCCSIRTDGQCSGREALILSGRSPAGKRRLLHAAAAGGARWSLG